MIALQQLIDHSDNIVFFGGAGVSTQSGIPDFRSANGLYKLRYKYPPETVVSRSFFHSHTAEFFKFYKENMLHLDAKPNRAHVKLAELESADKLKAVITQNVDGLHQLAGSKNVLELHGSVHRNHCLKCARQYDARYILQSEGVPQCDCGGLIKPDVVLYEEPLQRSVVESAIQYISEAEVLIIGGTSLSVYPAAALINDYRGSKLVLINKMPTPYDRRANLVINQNIADVLDEIWVK